MVKDPLKTSVVKTSAKMLFFANILKNKVAPDSKDEKAPQQKKGSALITLPPHHGQDNGHHSTWATTRQFLLTTICFKWNLEVYWIKFND
jgi:hypothetical protein